MDEDDVISKQVVINTVRKIILGFFSEKDGVMNDTEKILLSVSKAICNGVRELPSAQPDSKETSSTHKALDTISRQAAIEMCREPRMRNADCSDFEMEIMMLPSAQPEPAIPLQWIEAQIEWLKSLDIAFATSRAEHISAMVNIWKDKQNG